MKLTQYKIVKIERMPNGVAVKKGYLIPSMAANRIMIFISI